MPRRRDAFIPAPARAQIHRVEPSEARLTRRRLFQGAWAHVPHAYARTPYTAEPAQFATLNRTRGNSLAL